MHGRHAWNVCTYPSPTVQESKDYLGGQYVANLREGVMQCTVIDALIQVLQGVK